MSTVRSQNPVTRLATQAAYGASQLPRLAWYIGHGVAMQRLAAAARRRQGPDARPRARTEKPLPGQRRLFADMARLLRRDADNVAAGIYPLPIDNDGPPRAMLERSRLFFADLPRIHARRESGTTNDVLELPVVGKRPRYYLQNFHFQTGGWMTEESAERYDTQVEVMFKGTANAMRRQALPALHEMFAGRDQNELRLLDVGCGTGRFLDSVRQAWPRLHVTGLDLSESYARAARGFLGRGARADIMVANAEAIPFADGIFDAVTSVFMFHELPPVVRRRVFAEFSRVLKPGGRLVVVDSLQTGDVPEYDGMLELFPQNFHEPYFTSYIREDFSAMAAGVGLAHRADTAAFVSKVMVFDRAV